MRLTTSKAPLKLTFSPVHRYINQFQTNNYILKHEKLVMTQAAIDAVVAKASVAGKKAQRDGAEAVA